MAERHASASTRQVTIDAVFEQAIKAELRSAELYKHMAEGFSHSPGISEFWNGLRKDEVTHAKALKEIRKTLTDEHLAGNAEVDLATKARAVERFFEDLPPITTLQDAYEIAHDLEYTEINVLFLLLIKQFISSEDRKRFFVSEIWDHQAKLVSFSVRFGGCEGRKEIRFEPPQDS